MREKVADVERVDEERMPSGADNGRSPDIDVRDGLRGARWLRLKVIEDGEKVVGVTLPWFLCSGVLGLAGWILGRVPKATEKIEEELSGGMDSVHTVLRTIRRLPRGTRIEVQDDEDHVLIELC